jgi:hypothetical protein
MIGRSDYEERREARIERMKERAANRREEAEATRGRAMRTLNIIPAGQPILIGHHSEKRHRRDLERIANQFRRAAEADKEAANLAHRIDAAESNLAISSDDPTALDKLRAKLAGIENNRSKAVAINKAIRKHKGDESAQVAAVMALGATEAQARDLLQPDFCGRVGFPDYKLTNWSAEVRRIKARIASLEARATSEPKPDEKLGDITITEQDNRVMLLFPGKPSDAIRARLKSNGFRWSPTSGAWQRMPSEWAWHVAREIATAANNEEA